MPLLRLYSSRQGDSTQLLACVYACTATNKTYPVVSPRRRSSTSRPQGSRSTSCTPVYTRHAKEAAHSCSHEYMHTRRQAPRTRLRRRGRAAAHAAPKYILGTSWRQHTAARMRVCVHGDKQDVPGWVVVEEQQHMLHPNTYSAHHGDSTQLLACVYACTATSRTYPDASSWRGSSTRCSQGRSSISCTRVYVRSTPRRVRGCTHTATSRRNHTVRGWHVHERVPHVRVGGRRQHHTMPRQHERKRVPQHEGASTLLACVSLIQREASMSANAYRKYEPSQRVRQVQSVVMR